MHRRQNCLQFENILPVEEVSLAFDTREKKSDIGMSAGRNVIVGGFPSPNRKTRNA